jgi:two-component system, NarL family, nitrate/nitrite response regulator NarL
MPETTSRPIRLFLLDDHALFREGLLRLLKSDQTFEIIGSCSTAAEAAAQLEQSPVDVLILDYDLGDESSLEFVRDLQRKGFTGKILMVTAGLPDRDALEFIRLGVCGIFHKQHPPDDLHRSIREVAEGKVLIEQQYLQSLVAAATDSAREGSARLTNRDRQILRFLVEGLSNKEIAGQLQISESAVKASLQQLFAKTGVRTRSALVRVALEQYRDEI